MEPQAEASSVSNGILFRYPSKDDLFMTEDIESGSVDIPLLLSKYHNISKIINSTKSDPQEIIKSIRKNLNSSIPILKKYTLEKSLEKKLESVKPMIKLISNFTVLLRVNYTVKKFFIMVPFLDPVNYITTHDYLESKNYKRVVNLNDGIYGFLNSGRRIYAYEPELLNKKWGFNKDKTPTGVFITYKSNENFSTTPKQLPIGEHGENESYIGTLLKHEWTKQAVSAKAPEFDRFRMNKSREFNEKLSELAQRTKILMEYPPSISGKEKDDYKEKSLLELKDIYQQMKGNIDNELVYAELGKLMPQGNDQEVNFTGFGDIEVMYFDMSEKMIEYIHSDNKEIIKEYLDILECDYNENDLEEINKSINERLISLFEEDISAKIPTPFGIPTAYYEIIIKYFSENHFDWRLGRAAKKRKSKKKSRSKKRKSRQTHKNTKRKEKKKKKKKAITKRNKK